MDDTTWIGLGFGLVIAAALCLGKVQATPLDPACTGAILPAAAASGPGDPPLHTIAHRNRDIAQQIATH